VKALQSIGWAELEGVELRLRPFVSGVAVESRRPGNRRQVGQRMCNRTVYELASKCTDLQLLGSSDCRYCTGRDTPAGKGLIEACYSSRGMQMLYPISSPLRLLYN